MLIKNIRYSSFCEKWQKYNFSFFKNLFRHPWYILVKLCKDRIIINMSKGFYLLRFKYIIVPIFKFVFLNLSLFLILLLLKCINFIRYVTNNRFFLHNLKGIFNIIRNGFCNR